MLCDMLLENHGSLIPLTSLCGALVQIRIPLCRRRIADLRAMEISIENRDEVMVELELCVSLLFKPLRHHVQNIIEEGSAALMLLWVPIMEAVKEVMNGGSVDANEIVKSSNELVLEHVRNVVMVLINLNVLGPESSDGEGMALATWTSISEIEGCKEFVDEWKQAAENHHDS